MPSTLTPDQISNARQSANDNAQAAYQQGMLELGNKQLAFQKAQQAWKETMDTAGLTGEYQGMPTQAALEFGATAFGQWGAPQEGQQTLAAKQQDWSQANQNAQLYGSNVGQGGPAAGQQTLAGQQQGFQQSQDVAGLYGHSATGEQTLAGSEQGFTQGLRTQQEQRAAQGQQQTQAQQYLQLLASLRGPADWAKYQQVLGSTPGGMRDLVGAAMGQYVPGGGATTGMQPQAVSLQSMMGDVTGQAYQGQGGGPLNMPDVYAQNNAAMYSQQPPQAGGQWNQYQPQPGQMQTMELTPQQYQQQQQAQAGAQQQWAAEQPYAAQMRNMLTPPTAGQATAQAFTESMNPAVRQQMEQQRAQAQRQYQQAQPQQNNQQWNAQGNGTNTMGAQPQQQSGLPQNQMNLPAPNQIASQSWNNLAPTQKEMLMGQYEAQGWDKTDVEALRNQALPKYASNASTAGTWRLKG